MCGGGRKPQPFALVLESPANRVALLRREVVPPLKIVFHPPPLFRRQLLPLPVPLLIAIAVRLRHSVPFIHAPAHGVALLGRQRLPFLVLPLHAGALFRRHFVDGGVWAALGLGPIEARFEGKLPDFDCIRCRRSGAIPGGPNGAECDTCNGDGQYRGRRQHPQAATPFLFRCMPSRFHPDSFPGFPAQPDPAPARRMEDRRRESVSLSYPCPSKGQGV